MITKDNLRNLLTCLGFQQSETVQDEMNLHFDNTNCTIAVDFSNEKIIYHERSKDCIVLNFRLLINQNAKKWHCRHSHFSQMQNVHLPFSMLHHAPGYGIIGTRSSDQKPLR